MKAAHINQRLGTVSPPVKQTQVVPQDMVVDQATNYCHRSYQIPPISLYQPLDD